MLHIYVNYPEAHFTTHSEPTCREIRKRGKEAQRLHSLDAHSLGSFLTQAARGEYPFGSDSSKNDMWLELSLPTSRQELAFVDVFQAVIGVRYLRLLHAPIVNHC